MEKTVNEILNFTFSPAAFQQAGKNSFTVSITRLHEVRINKLNKITEEVGISSFKIPSKNLIPQVFKKFKAITKNGGLLLENFEKRELRTLTYSLSHSEQNLAQIFSKPNELDFAFETLETSWKDSYLIGLIDCYLKKWETNYQASAEKLGDFIFKKLRKYDGNRTVLKSLKANIKFFDSRNGDVLLGSELAIKNKQIKEATKYLSLPDSWFTYPYFSKVILAYFIKRQNEIQQFIDDLKNVLNEHKNSITDRRVISQLVIQANKLEFIFIKEKVKKIALERLLDPQRKDSIWHPFEGATESEISEIRIAKKIVLQWLAEQFINVFFEKCINDTRRKRFWLKYSKEITDFRVVGSAYIKSILLTDNRISDYVTPRFSRTNSSIDGNAALMFIMGNHLFVEFSDTGAFYAYKLSNTNAPSIEKDFFYSTNDLKLTYLLQLLDRQGNTVTNMAEEGKLPHRDGIMDWEDAANYWIKNKAGINV